MPMAGDSEFDALQRDDVLERLAQRIAQLPPTQKTVLALYYHEDLEPAEIATCLDMTESEIDQIRAETVGLLQTMLATQMGLPEPPASFEQPRDAGGTGLPVLIFCTVAVCAAIILIGMTSAMLGGAPPIKSEAPRPDTAELNAHTLQDAVGVESKPTSMDPPVRSTSGYASLLPTPGSLIKGFPGSPYQPPVTSKPVLRRFGTESDVRGRRFHRKLSAVDNWGSKRKWPKAFVLYLEAHQKFLRKLQENSQTASL